MTNYAIYLNLELSEAIKHGLRLFRDAVTSCFSVIGFYRV